MSSQKAFCALCPQAAGQQQGQEQQQGQQGQEQQECVAPAPLGGQQILGPDICRDHLRSICANVWVSALNVYHDRCSHTESRKLEWRWIKNSFNIYYFFESPLPWFKELLLKCLRKVWPSKKGSDRNLSIKSKHWDTDATDIQLSTAWCDSHITWYDLSLYDTTCMWQIL